MVTHTKDDSYWTYDYDVNRWIETRRVVTTDYDHSPYFGEYTLKESGREDGIGAERAIEEKIYRALGTEIHGYGELVEVTIPEDMWETLTDKDEINYKQAKVGGRRILLWRSERSDLMVYIFESTISMSQGEKLEQVRQQLIDQIRDGVVLLPVNMRLKEVVDTPMGMDVLVNVETKGSKLNL